MKKSIIYPMIFNGSAVVTASIPDPLTLSNLTVSETASLAYVNTDYILSDEITNSGSIYTNTLFATNLVSTQTLAANIVGALTGSFSRLEISGSAVLSGGLTTPLALVGFISNTSASIGHATITTADMGGTTTIDTAGINTTQPIIVGGKNIAFSSVVDHNNATASFIDYNDKILICSSSADQLITIGFSTNNSQAFIINESTHTVNIQPSASINLISKNGNNLVGSGSGASLVYRNNKIYLFGDLS